MRRTLCLLLIGCSMAAMTVAAPAQARRKKAPEWVRPALHYLVDKGYFSDDNFRANDTMRRRAFKRLMSKAFGGGFHRSHGVVTAGEVGGSLVKALGFGSLARSLSAKRSPNGWDPGLSRRFGTEVVARELGLRHDWPTTSEVHEASDDEAITQGDAIWAVWRAKVAPDQWAAEALSSFSLSNYRGVRRAVIKFALSLTGTPYVYGGEWVNKTPSGYPYGAQTSGGVDCSGFAWYVLQKKSSSYNPIGRPYKGWSIAQRSSYDMAKAAPKRLSFSALKPADIVFFAERGRKAKANEVYHAGIYLGKGWMIHSSGSRDGISLADIGKDSWWHSQFFGGRRVIR